MAYFRPIVEGAGLVGERADALLVWGRPARVVGHFATLRPDRGSFIYEMVLD